MGTRSLTKVFDYSGNLLVAMYGQYDGYYAGHGQRLADWLKTLTLVNGLSIGENLRVANGPGCLAAQLIAHFKDDPGGFYIALPDPEDEEEYTYEVRCMGGYASNQPKSIVLRAKGGYGWAFEGAPGDFDGERLDAVDDRGDRPRGDRPGRAALR